MMKAGLKKVSRSAKLSISRFVPLEANPPPPQIERGRTHFRVGLPLFCPSFNQRSPHTRQRLRYQINPQLSLFLKPLQGLRNRQAIATVRKKMEKDTLRNIEPVLIAGYDSTLSDDSVDVICAIDMFWIIKQPTEFLKELRRIIKPDGTLIVDDGHQRRSVTKKKIGDSAVWDITEETRDHLKCKPR